MCLRFLYRIYAICCLDQTSCDVDISLVRPITSLWAGCFSEIVFYRSSYLLDVACAYSLFFLSYYDAFLFYRSDISGYHLLSGLSCLVFFAQRLLVGSWC